MAGSIKMEVFCVHANIVIDFLDRMELWDIWKFIPMKKICDRKDTVKESNKCSFRVCCILSGSDTAWVLFPSPRNLPDPGIKLCLLHWQVDSLPLSHLRSPENIIGLWNNIQNKIIVALGLMFDMQSMGSQRVGHDWVTSLSLFTFMPWRRKWQPTPVFLPGESQGRGSLVGCRLWGRTEPGTTEAT